MSTTDTDPQSSGPIRLLYVAPDRDDATVAALEDDHSMAVTARSRASEALAAIDRAPFDCLVSEVSLPGTDGIDLLDAVRRRDPDLPVVLYTRATEPELVDRACSAGAGDYLRSESAVDPRWLPARIASLVADRAGGSAADEEDPPHPGGSCLLDADLSIRDASESFAAVLGHDRAALHGTALAALFLEEGDRSAAVRDAVRRHDGWTDDAIGIRPDGRTVPVRRSIERFDADRYLCAITDRTGADGAADPIERLARQRRTLGELFAKVRNGDDADDVLRSATEGAAAALDGEYCGLFEYRPADGFRLGAGVGWEDDDEAIEDPTVQAHLRDALRSAAPIRLVEGAADDGDEADRASEDDVESGLGVRIEAFGRPWGVLAVYGTSRYAVSHGEDPFASTVAALIGLAVERDRRAEAWAAVRDFAAAVFDLDSRQAVCDRVGDAMAAVEGVRGATVYLFDEDGDVLRRRVRSRDGAGDVTADPAETIDDGPAWHAFVAREPTYVAELSATPAIPVADPSIARGVVLPVGRHGVIVARTDRDRAAAAAENGALVASIARTGLSRLDHRERLTELRGALATERQSLERCVGRTDLSRRVGRAIVDATSRSALERAVCDELVGADPIAFAWIGGYDESGETIEPRAWAGAERSYLNSVAIDVADAASDQEPIGAAVRTLEPQSIDRLLASDSTERWRREATARGFRSLVSVPIHYGDVRYGGLTAYADRPTAFDRPLRWFLEDVGERVGHALHALAVKRTLFGDAGVVELEFRVWDRQLPFVAWAAEADGRVDLESVFTGADGSIRGFFSIDGLSVDRVLELACRSAALTDTRFVAERDDRRLFACTFTDDSLAGRLLEYGAVIDRLTIEGDGGILTVSLPETIGVRTFVTAFTEAYPDSELVGRRRADPTPRTRFEFAADVEDALTDRQYEVLRTAYRSGYYETPRKNSGNDVAALLDIAQPTFNHHLHAAHRKLLRLLFEDETVDEEEQ